MEIREEIISYPFIKYDARVSHVTSRESTAFEWLFLESLIKAQQTEFEDENIEDFFRNYFQIDNPQKLILPVLKTLYDLQAVSCAKLTDDTELSELLLKDVQILPLGKEMQQKGLLPGEHSSDKIEVVFDVSQNKLIWETKKLSSEAQGNYVQIEEGAFPERLVREYIESQRPKNENAEQSDIELAEEMISGNPQKNEDAKKQKKKNKGKNKQKIDWLRDNTEIESVMPAKKEICFENIPRKVQLKDGLVWKIESNKITELEEASLENFENPLPDALSDIPLTAISKPDKEIEQIVLFANLKNNLQRHLKDDSFKTEIIERSLFDENLLNQSNSGKGKNGGKNNKNEKNGKNSDFKAVVLSGASQLSVRTKNNILIVEIPEKVLPANCIFMTARFPMNVERFPIRAGDVSKEIPFAYLPKNHNHDFKGSIRNIVQKYCEKNPVVLFLMNEESGLKDEFGDYLGKMISEGSVREKSDRISEINKIANDLTGKKLISDEEILRTIIDEEKIKSSVSDIASARKIISEYSEISCVGNSVLRNLMKIALENAAPSDSLEEIWELFDFIKQKSADSLGFLDKQRVLGKLYTASAKESVIEKAFAGQLKSPRCDFEERSAKLANVYQTIENTKNSGNQKLRGFLNDWKVGFENFRKYYGNVEQLEKCNASVEEIRAAQNQNGKDKGGNKK